MSTQTISLTDSNNNKLLPESAESGNGYCKLADGTLICWGSITIPASESVGTQKVQTQFPIRFNATPKATVSFADNPNTTFNYFDFIMVDYQQISASTMAIAVNRKRIEYSWYASYLAIGRWK